MWLRRRRGLPVYDLPPSDHRRVIAGSQFTFLCLVLWPALSPQITLLAAYLFAIPLALSFARDWLVVSGVVDPASAPYRRARHTTKRLVEGWLPLGARLVAVLITALILGRELPGFPQWGTLLGQARENGGTTPLLGIAVAGAVAAFLLLPGIAGRVAAALLFGLACVDILAAGLGWPGNALLLACAAIVLHLGSGRFSLWKPEERFLRPRPGGSRPTDS
jgi:CDP-diacylglycerol--glycerol-3-phosphate 3-phosphatidyltransferase